MSDQQIDSGSSVPTFKVFPARTLTALIQAAALYLFADAKTAPITWPATDPRVFEPLTLVFDYVPLIVIVGLGQIRARPLALWAGFAAIIIAMLGYHDAAREQVAAVGAPLFVNLARTRLWVALSASAFVAHALVVDTVVERKFFPPYPRHFDTAWKQGLQIVLALVFIGIFWGILYLGAGLFKLVDIDFFLRLIMHRWFVYPATAIALAVSIHVTDVQPTLIRGTRSLILTLFSWLLPLLSIFIFGFLLTLPFISLAPLWRTHFATGLLLVASGLLVFLINCSYQDGAAERTTLGIKRITGTLGALELAPLVTLAAWALSLRVRQHGWSVERILAAAIIIVALCYAIGYATATAQTPSWLKRLEITNFLTAYVFLSLVVALFTSLADPARLMVADQLARLKSGRVSADKFDFAALKFDGARWGAAALTKLSQEKDEPEAAAIAAKASAALALVSRWSSTPQPVAAETLVERIMVYPEGRILPSSFFDNVSGALQKAGIGNPMCLQTAQLKCVARFVTLKPGEPEAILFVDTFAGYLFEQDASGQWHKTAQASGAISCHSLRQSLGNAAEFAVEPHPWPDLVVGGHRLSLSAPPDACDAAATPSQSK